jgi:hypothetical protein
MRCEAGPLVAGPRAKSDVAWEDTVVGDEHVTERARVAGARTWATYPAERRATESVGAQEEARTARTRRRAADGPQDSARRKVERGPRRDVNENHVGGRPPGTSAAASASRRFATASARAISSATCSGGIR